MKKQKSIQDKISEALSSDDESQIAKPKIDKEELKKLIKDSDDDESSQEQLTPKCSPKKNKKSQKTEKSTTSRFTQNPTQ